MIYPTTYTIGWVVKASPCHIRERKKTLQPQGFEPGYSKDRAQNFATQPRAARLKTKKCKNVRCDENVAEEEIESLIFCSISSLLHFWVLFLRGVIFKTYFYPLVGLSVFSTRAGNSPLHHYASQASFSPSTVFLSLSKAMQNNEKWKKIEISFLKMS